MADRTIRVRLEALTQEYAARLRAASQTTRSEGRAMMGVVERNSAAFTGLGIAVGAAGAAITFGLRGAAKENAAFQSSLTKSVTLIGVSSDEMQKMGREALGLSATGQGPRDLADALFFAQSAGLRGAEAMDVVESSAKAASLGLGETKEIVDLVTSAMNAYGSESLSAEQATDTLIGAVREGKAEASELAGALGQVLPVASEMGVTFDEVGAAVAGMTRTGTNAGTAAMQLRQILANLLKPAQGVEEAMTELGLSAQGLRDTIREDGLWAALMSLRDAAGDNEEALGRLFPNVRALAGFLDLTGANAAANEQIFRQMADTTGLLSDGFEEWSKTTEASQARFSASMEAVRIALGEGLQRPMRAALDLGSGMAQMFLDMPGPMQGVVTWGSAVVGVAATMAGGFLVAAPRIMATRTALAELAEVAPRTVGALSAVRSFLFGPWGVAIAGAITAVGLYARAKQEAIRRSEEFMATLDQETGALTENSTAHAVRRLQEEGAIDAGRRLGISAQTLTDAILGNEDALQRVNNVLEQYAPHLAAERTRDMRDGLDENRLAADTLRGALGLLGAEIGRGQERWRQEAVDLAEANGRYLDLQHAIESGVDPALAGLTIRHQDQMKAAADAIDPTGQLAEDLGLMGDGAEGAADAMDILAEKAKEWQSVVEQQFSASEAMTRAMDENREAAEQAAEAHNDAIDKQIAKLKDGEDATRESLESQKLSWEDFLEDVSIAQVTQHLQDVNEEFHQWREDLDTIAARAGGGVAERLALMGPEWAPIIREAVGATAQELAALDAAMAENISLQETAAKMAVQMEIITEKVRQGSQFTAQSIAEATGIALEVVEETLAAFDAPEIAVDANIDPALAEFIELEGLAHEFDTLVAIATADANGEAARRQFAEVHGLGGKWDEEMFQAFLDGEIEAVVQAFLEVHGLADKWEARRPKTDIEADRWAADNEFAAVEWRARNWDDSEWRATLGTREYERAVSQLDDVADRAHRFRGTYTATVRVSGYQQAIRQFHDLEAAATRSASAAAAGREMAAKRVHTGGEVTPSGILRFHGGGQVRRYHDGATAGFGRLAADEVPAILQVGETIWSAQDSAMLRSAIGTVRPDAILSALAGRTAPSGPTQHYHSHVSGDVPAHTLAEQRHQLRILAAQNS